MERDAVAIQDGAGRIWICYPIARRKVENLTMLAHVSDIFEADALARRQGISQQGTEVRIYYCEDQDELLEKLLQDTASETDEK